MSPWQSLCSRSWIGLSMFIVQALYIIFLWATLPYDKIQMIVMRNHLRIMGHETIKYIQYKFWEINPILRLLNENTLFWEHSQTLYIRRYRHWQSDTNSPKKTRTSTQAIRISLALPPLYDGISSVENPVTKLAYICGKATSLRRHSINREHGNQATCQVCLKSQLLIFFFWITPSVSIAPDKAVYCVFTQFRRPENSIKLISVRTKTQ